MLTIDLLYDNNDSLVIWSFLIWVTTCVFVCSVVKCYLFTLNSPSSCKTCWSLHILFVKPVHKHRGKNKIFLEKGIISKTFLTTQQQCIIWIQSQLYQKAGNLTVTTRLHRTFFIFTEICLCCCQQCYRWRD